jgi:hypothetical protein
MTPRGIEARSTDELPHHQCLARSRIFFLHDHTMRHVSWFFPNMCRKPGCSAPKPVNANLGNAGNWDSNGPNVSRNNARNSNSNLGLGFS